jgi:hypothetical protein
MSRTKDAVNDTCELTEAELDLVAGGQQPPHYEFGASYGFDDLHWDFLLSGLYGTGRR